MGKVATVFKVYGDGKNEGTLAESIQKILKPNSIQLEEVAFGIKVIKVLFVHEDSEGSTGFEDKLRKVSGVNEVEISDESLI